MWRFVCWSPRLATSGPITGVLVRGTLPLSLAKCATHCGPTVQGRAPKCRPGSNIVVAALKSMAFGTHARQYSVLPPPCRTCKCPLSTPYKLDMLVLRYGKERPVRRRSVGDCPEAASQTWHGRPPLKCGAMANNFPPIRARIGLRAGRQALIWRSAGVPQGLSACATGRRVVCRQVSVGSNIGTLQGLIQLSLQHACSSDQTL